MVASRRPDAAASMPVAIVQKVTDGKRTRIVEVLCPFCGLSHFHGWPYDTVNEQIGPRVAHCLTAGRQTYDVRYVEPPRSPEIPSVEECLASWTDAPA
jgi:hypothetical protein